MKKTIVLATGSMALIAVTAGGAAAAAHAPRTAAPTPPHVTAASGKAYRIAHYKAAQDIHGKVVPEHEIIADARRAAAGPGAPVAPESAAAHAQLMTLGAFDDANHLATDPLLSTSRKVWVVTVHAKTPLLTPPGQAARSADVYTVVYDAISGAAIEKGVNVNFVK